MIQFKSENILQFIKRFSDFGNQVKAMDGDDFIQIDEYLDDERNGMEYG